MGTLYKERPGGAFISTALFSLWQHRRNVVLRIWAVNLLLMAIFHWFDLPRLGLIVCTLWLWWNLSEQILADDQAGTEALCKTTGRDDENPKLSDENAQLFEPRSELWETSFVSLPGFRHMPLLRMFISAVVLVVVMLFSSAVDDFWLSFFVTLLCFVAPLLLVFRPTPGESLLSMLPRMIRESLFPLFSVLFCFGIWVGTVGVSGWLISLSGWIEIVTGFLPKAYLNAIDSVISPRLFEVITTVLVAGVYQIPITFIFVISTYMLGHVVDCTDHRGLYRRLDTF